MKTRTIIMVWLCSAAVGAAAPASPNKTGPKTGKPAAPLVEQMGKIDGWEIARPSGTYLGLKIEGGNFMLSFYDEKKKPMTADVARGTARWDPPQKKGKEFSALNPTGDGMALVGNKFVRPPYNWIVFLTLLNNAGETVENYSVNPMVDKPAY